MKNKNKLILLAIPFLLASCAVSSRDSKSNLIASLFESSQSSTQSSSENQLSSSSSSLSVTTSSSLISSSEAPIYDHIDVDLTTMSSTMVYSQVLNMLEEPSKYIGKIIKMSGPFRPFKSTNINYCYPAILITDATACCGSGIEFLLYGVPLCSMKGGNGYPLYEEEATIVGRFETYLEGSSMYIHLVDAIWLESHN